MWLRCIIVGVLSGWCCVVAAQNQIAVADTSSPRATLISFLDAADEAYELIKEHRYFDGEKAMYRSVAVRVLDCMDVRDLPAFTREEAAGEIAIALKEILDRHELPDWADVPDLEMIEAFPGSDRYSRYRIPGTRITIAKVEDGPQKHEYLFTAGTIERAVGYYKSIEGVPYRTTGRPTSPGFYNWYISAPRKRWVGTLVSSLPDGLRFRSTLGISNWKWPGLILLVLGTPTLMWLCYRTSYRIASRARGKSVFAYCLTLVFPAVAIIIPLVAENLARDYLTIRGEALYTFGFIANAISIIAIVILILSASSRVTDTVIASPKINPSGLNAQLIRIAGRLLSMALAVVAFMVGGQYLGIPVATLLASAGIGGVALALGAQDTLKTLFGTLMLMADKPFRVGDRIVFKGYDGVVEDVGLRSTRLRLLSSHQVSIPNDELARCDIENVGRRNCIRRVVDIHLPLQTPVEKTEKAVEIVRAALKDHEGMEPEYPPRVFFLDFLPDAFAIRAIYWYHPPNYWEYLAFGERFNFEVFQAFEANGIEFKLPERIVPGEWKPGDWKPDGLGPAPEVG